MLTNPYSYRVFPRSPLQSKCYTSVTFLGKLTSFVNIFSQQKIAQKTPLNPDANWLHDPNQKVTTKLPFGNLSRRNPIGSTTQKTERLSVSNKALDSKS